MKGEMKVLAHKERSGTYHYADGGISRFSNVSAVGVTKSGFHKLEANGGKYIVAPGWRYITLDMKDWTF